MCDIAVKIIIVRKSLSGLINIKGRVAMAFMMLETDFVYLHDSFFY